MDRINTLLVCLFLVGISTTTWSQKYVVKGTVLDSASRPLPSATVMLLERSDSSLVGFQVSGPQGLFELKNVSKGNYFVKVTFTGLVPVSRIITLPTEPGEINAGEFKMLTMTTLLSDVVIQGEVSPVTVKRDTIEYNAAAFKTKANANVEDLLKKMPGIEVETDGTVRAQGEQVRKVMVDGKEFFGRDPKLATRNLPADAVNKVQVFDQKSDQAIFSGIDDGQRDKTINLELKEEKRKGAFGTLMGGVGTEDRFQGRLSLNRFRKAEQLSVLGMANNINEQGFSFEDYFNFSGAASQLAGGRAGGGGSMSLRFGGDSDGGIPLNTGGRQNGIVTNYAGGVNFNKDLTKKTTLTSSYFYNRLDQDVTKNLNRINYLPNGNDYTFMQNSRQKSLTDSHRGNLILEHKIDSANSLKWNTSATYSETENRFLSESQSFDGNDQLQNESVRSTFSEGTSQNLNTSLLYRHRFAKKGRTFSTNLGMILSNTQTEGTLNSENEFFTGPVQEENLLQQNTRDSHNQTYSATLSYTEPLGGRKYLEANYAIRTNINEVDQFVYDDVNGSQVLNNTLSNQYTSNYLYQRPGLNFRLNQQKYNLAIGASYQLTTLKGELRIQDIKIDRTFENLLPSARFNYDFSSARHLRLDYETSLLEPSIQQLQPIINNTDPLNISLGNPELKPAYMHTATLNYTAFDQAKFVNFFSLLTAVYMQNALTTAQTVDPSTLVRTSQPVNTDYSFVLNANVNFGFRWKKLNSRFNIGPTARLDRSVNLLNNQENEINQQTLGGSLRYNYTYKEVIILDLSTNLSQQQTKYDFAGQDQEFLNQSYRAELNINFLKKYSFSPDFEYLIYDSRTTDFNQTIPLLNLSVSRFLLKNNAGELKVAVNNLLDRNISVTQTATTNFLQQERMNNLGRYFMISFTYALNKQLNPMGGGRRGTRMIIRS